MPTYRFRDMNSGEEFDEFMSMSERENYLKTHPLIAQVPVPVAFVGDHIMGVGPKNDSGFNEVMGKIADGYPLSPMADKYGTSKTASQRRARDTFSKVTKKYKNKLDNLNK